MMSLPLFIEYKDDLTKQPPYSIAFSHYERDWNVLPWQRSLVYITQQYIDFSQPGNLHPSLIRRKWCANCKKTLLCPHLPLENFVELLSSKQYSEMLKNKKHSYTQKEMWEQKMFSFCLFWSSQSSFSQGFQQFTVLLKLEKFRQFPKIGRDFHTIFPFLISYAIL